MSLEFVVGRHRPARQGHRCCYVILRLSAGGMVSIPPA